MGILSGLVRAAVPAVGGYLQGRNAQEAEAYRRAQVERDREDKLKHQAMLMALEQAQFDAQQKQVGVTNKRNMRLDERVPTQVVDRLGPDGRPRTYQIPEYGGEPMDTGLQPIPEPQGAGSGQWQVVDDFSGQYGPPGQKVRVNKLTGEVVPIAARGRAPVSAGATTAQRNALAENNALIADIDRTIAALRANPDATGLLKGAIGSLPGGQYALAGQDRGGDVARQGIGLLRSKVLHDFIGGAQTRIELTNLKDALPERGFDAQTNINRLTELKKRAQRANAAIAGGSSDQPGAADTGLDAWAGGDPEKLQFLREMQQGTP